jgi:peptide/nickel transport system permease protein
MLRYIARRLLGAVATMLIVATIVFFVMNIVPGDPAYRILGPEATPAEIRQLQEHLGLGRPIFVRFVEWFAALLRGDLGRSLFNHESVGSLILSRVEPTFLLTFLASILAVGLGVSLGTLAALTPGSALDMSTMSLALFGVAVPNFWLGLNLILLFSLRLHWLPTAGYASLETGWIATLRYLTLPALALGLAHTAVIARMTRANLMEVLTEDYVRTARAKGLRERTIVARHALRNAFVPTLGVIGVSLALLLGGAIIVETVFAIPGVGLLVIEAILRKDFPVIQGVLLWIALITALVNLAVDILYGVLDPRIAYE